MTKTKIALAALLVAGTGYSFAQGQTLTIATVQTNPNTNHIESLVSVGDRFNTFRLENSGTYLVLTDSNSVFLMCPACT